ncbi:hypothetical protein GCM10022247_02240 [Allokutzneria multivorans]|uniref:Uncharacterized protein n=1 Tax=Allokutzneria multivorans TaxID=1142134 RepID=A0ABP7QTT0_9PSEU
MITVRRLRVRSAEGHFQVVEVDESGADGADVARSDGSDETTPITSFSDENGLLFRLRETHGKSLSKQEARGPADELLGVYWTRTFRDHQVVEQDGRRYVGRERRRGKRLWRKLLANIPFVEYDERFVDYDFHVGGTLALTVESEPVDEADPGTGKPGSGWTHEIGATAMSDGPGVGSVLGMFTDGPNVNAAPEASCHLVHIHDPELGVRVVLGLIVLLARSPR